MKIGIDHQTEVPLDLFQDLMGAAERAKSSGQHVVIETADGKQRLRRASVIGARCGGGGFFCGEDEAAMQAPCSSSASSSPSSSDASPRQAPNPSAWLPVSAFAPTPRRVSPRGRKRPAQREGFQAKRLRRFSTVFPPTALSPRFASRRRLRGKQAVAAPASAPVC
eukprot:TRINITY_DN4447_c2_g1_i1.p2 TRINITY_DN4447_c2_g1~~TRINITY_DN4447_c2_g1_i1.p2  ORF type:complete len:166 (-),score=42.87 TRINITY_DN4447_c2_g1_i1:63-560(-)